MRAALIVLGLVLAAVLAWIWSTGALDGLSDRAQLAETFSSLGPLGPVLFIGVVLALFPVFLIGPPVWSAVAVWPPVLALAYASVACILASVLCYALARSLGRAWAQQRIPASVRRYEDRLESHPLRTILLLRLLLWANPAVDLLVGISRVSTRDYLIGTVCGLIPVTAFHVFLVSRGLEYALALPGWLWLPLASLVAGALALRGLRKRRRRALLAPQLDPEP